MHCEGGTLRIPDYTRAIAFDAAGKEIQRFEGATDHYANFVDAVRSRKAADLRGSIREGHVSSALCHMGNVSHELGSLQGKAEIAAAVAKLPEASAACERLFAHLEANGVDLEKSPLRLGKWLAMDPATERFRDDPAAERLATREYRAGFVVPSEV